MSERVKVILKRLWSKIEVNEETGCWEWRGAIKRDGYGYFRKPAKWYGRQEPVAVHRVMYELYVGDVDGGLQIDHLCRNRKCCNPSHLDVVTQTENLRRGEGTKLSHMQVSMIKRMIYNKSSIREIAKQFNVSNKCIRDIKTGRCWKDVS